MSNLIAGLKFEHKNNIFTAYFQKQGASIWNEDFSLMLKGLKDQ